MMKNLGQSSYRMSRICLLAFYRWPWHCPPSPVFLVNWKLNLKAWSDSGCTFEAKTVQRWRHVLILSHIRRQDVRWSPSVCDAVWSVRSGSGSLLTHYEASSLGRGRRVSRSSFQKPASGCWTASWLWTEPLPCLSPTPTPTLTLQDRSWASTPALMWL